MEKFQIILGFNGILCRERRIIGAFIVSERTLCKIEEIHGLGIYGCDYAPKDSKTVRLAEILKEATRKWNLLLNK